MVRQSAAEGELRRQIVREMGGGRVGDYRLLLRLGTDLPGAVTVHGDNEPDDVDDPTTAEDARDDEEHPLRYSLAGVQLKYSVHSSRLTLPMSGDGTWWIVKLPDPSLHQLAENEYVTMRWLDAAGMDVPPVECLTAESVPNAGRALRTKACGAAHHAGLSQATWTRRQEFTGRSISGTSVRPFSSIPL